MNCKAVHYAKFQVKDIVNILKISESTIWKYLQRVKHDGGQGDGTHRELCSRQMSTTEEEDDAIIRKAGDNPFSSLSEIKTNIGLTCSKSTICRRLTHADLKCRKPVKKTELTVRHREICKQWAMNKML